MRKILIYRIKEKNTFTIFQYFSNNTVFLHKIIQQNKHQFNLLFLTIFGSEILQI